MNPQVDSTYWSVRPQKSYKTILMPALVLIPDQGHATVLRLEGHARVETATRLRETLAQAPLAQPVAIEWDQAEHVDACVLQVLLALRKLLMDRGLSFAVGKDNAKVRAYLNWSGLSEYFPVQSPSPEPQPVGDSHA